MGACAQVTVWDGSTGALINHMRDNHSTEFKKMVERGDIKGTSKRMVVDGNVVERLSFEEAFTYHVDFVVMCCVDGIPFYSSRKKGMRKFSGRLKPGYVPPHRKTCVRILKALDALCDDEKAVRLAEKQSAVHNIRHDRQKALHKREEAERALVASQTRLAARAARLEATDHYRHVEQTARRASIVISHVLRGKIARRRAAASAPMPCSPSRRRDGRRP